MFGDPLQCRLQRPTSHIPASFIRTEFRVTWRAQRPLGSQETFMHRGKPWVHMETLPYIKNRGTALSSSLLSGLWLRHECGAADPRQKCQARLASALPTEKRGRDLCRAPEGPRRDSGSSAALRARRWDCGAAAPSLEPLPAPHRRSQTPLLA